MEGKVNGHFSQSGNQQYAYPYSQYMWGAPNGNVRFVHSTLGSNVTGQGYYPETPFASVAYALSTCVADNDDHVVLLPGHVETLGAAAAIAMSIAGVTIRSWGRGRQRGRLNWSTAVGASLDVTAARCRLEDLILTMTGVDAITAGINAQASDLSIVGCEFELATASAQATLGILTTAAADRLLVKDCHFHGSSDAGTTAAICLVGGDSIRIEDCIFHGAYSSGVGAIQNITTACTGLQLLRNKIQNLTAGCTKAIVAVAGTTGMIAENRMQILSGAAPITAAGMAWGGNNTYAAALATAGTAI